MAGILKVFGYLRLAFVFALPFAVLVEEKNRNGEEKRAEVVQLLKDEFAKQGINFPEWMNRFLDPLLGVIVDVVVYLMNKSGFFEHGTN